MKQTISTLANGLRVVTTEMTESESVVVTIVVGTGSRYENFNVDGGVSHILEHMLFKGSRNYPTAEAISLAIDEAGGYNDAYTSEEVTNYFVKVPKRHGKLAIQIIADMVRYPLIDQEELDCERGVIIEEMNVWRDDPARNIYTLLPPIIFPGTGLGQTTFGPTEVINAISRGAVLQYFQTFYRPANMVVAVAGRIEHETVLAEVERLLGDMVNAEWPSAPKVTTLEAARLTSPLLKDTAQTHFMVASRGYAYEDPCDMPAEVLATVLGRGASSRLFMNVRERQGLAYHVSAQCQNFVDTGLFEVYAGVNLDKVEQAVDSVLHELDKIRQEPVSEAELAKAQQQMIAGLEMSLESNSSVADRTGTDLILRGYIPAVEEIVARIEAVSVEQVQEVAREMLAPERLRFACIGPDAEANAVHFEEEIKKYQENYNG